MCIIDIILFCKQKLYSTNYDKTNYDKTKYTKRMKQISERIKRDKNGEMY
jgi:hypothetical protein